jgi:FkbM family methyltransferase
MNQENKQQLTLLNTISDAVEYIKIKPEAEQHLYQRLKEAFLAIGLPTRNRMIELLDTLPTNRSQLDEFAKLFDKWLDLNIIALSNRIRTSDSYKKGLYGADRKFNELISLINGSHAQTLITHAMDCLQKIRDENPPLYEFLTVGYRGWYFENNWLDGIGGKNNSLINNRITTLKNNISKFEWFYDHLEDNLSKRSLNALINNWLTFSMNEALDVSLYASHNVVANTDIFPLYENEVFVDCGAYVGDTVADFVNEFNRGYRNIYTYEISAPTVDIMKKHLQNLRNVIYNVKGVADQKGELSLAGVDGPFLGNRLVEGKGIKKVPIVKLDDDIQEPITFLKIDVEGLDKQAILGAKEQIAQHHPKMHIDTYHKLADVVDVPLLVHSIDPTYRFYLRLTNSTENKMMFAISCIYPI